MNNSNDFVNENNDLILQAFNNVKVIDLNISEKVVVFNSRLHGINQIIITRDIVCYVLCNKGSKSSL